MVVLVAGLTACNDSQPERSETRTASISMVARADGLLYDCYEVWSDDNGDGVPDSQTQYTSCVQTSVPENRPVPWRYSLWISVLPKDSTTEQIVASVDGLPGSSVVPGDHLDDFVSLTDYDPVVGTAGPRVDEPPLYYRNGKQVSVGSPIYLDANGFGSLGTPNILTASSSFDFTVQSGDTVIVRARKQPVADSAGFITAEYPDLKISATFAVGGTPVVTNGPTASTGDDRSGFTFSYTVQ